MPRRARGKRSSAEPQQEDEEQQQEDEEQRPSKERRLTRAERGLPTGERRAMLTRKALEMRHELVWALLTAAGWTKVVKVERRGDCWLIAARINAVGMAHAEPSSARDFGGGSKRTKLTAMRHVICNSLSGVGLIFSSNEEVEAWADQSFILGKSTNRRTGQALSKLFAGWRQPCAWPNPHSIDATGSQIRPGVILDMRMSTRTLDMRMSTRT